MKPTIIYGNGAHSDLVYYLLKEEGWDIKGFTVEKKYITHSQKFHLPIIPFENIVDHFPPSKYSIIIAIGPTRVNKVREKFFLESINKGYEVISFISSNARLCSDFKYGKGNFVDNSSNAHPFVRMGNNNIIINSNLGHHVSIGNNCTISGTILAGNVTIEDNVFIGLGSVVQENVKIGEGSLIGMGCRITKDVEPFSVYSEKPSIKRKGLDSRNLRFL